MSSIDLIILGYLQYGEKSAYEMVKEFETWNIHRWLKISNPSIYKNIIKLSNNGYLDSRVVKEGEMPEKIIYSINEKGYLYFNELMEYSSKNIGYIYFEFNAFLSNLSKLSNEKRNEYLKNFRQQIVEHKNIVYFNHEKFHKYGHPNSAIVLDLYKELFDLLDRWSVTVLQQYNVPLDD